LTAATIAMILKCILDDCKISDLELHVSCNDSVLEMHSINTVITQCCTGIYNTSDLGLHVLEQTVTITQITMQSKAIDHRRSAQGTLWRKKSQKKKKIM
jgi:hypothetical protein